MEREEDQPKKRSWFSRKKTDSSAVKVSRPPTASSYSSFHKKTNSASSADDDLPPREPTPSLSSPPASRSATPVLNTSKVDPPTSEPGTPETAIPKFAGFDLGAMKAVINDSERKPEELRVPAPTPSHAPPTLAPHPSRSESAPPSNPQPLSTSPRMQSTSTLYEHAAAGPSSSHHDLSSTLARSMSLNDVHAAESDEEDDVSLHDRRTPTRLQPSPTVTPSYIGVHGSGWPGESDRGASSSSSYFTDSSRERMTFGGPPPDNPLRYGSSSSASRTMLSPQDSATLSFGGADGSITLSPPIRRDAADPWDIAPPVFGGYNSKKTSSTLNLGLNPWQS